MAQQVQVRIKKGKQAQVQDAVLFMAAYDIHEIKKNFVPLSLRKKSKNLFEEFHITSISTNEYIATKSGKFEYSLEYNSLEQRSSYNFNTTRTKNQSVVEAEIKNLHWMIPLRHAASVILGDGEYHINYCINAESFLVRIKNETFQVDPVIFTMNGLIFICYELIHYESETVLSYDEIYGKKHNYNILPVSGVRYFNSDDFVEDNRKISDIIFNNVTNFIEKVLNKKYHFGSHSYVHNTYVRSNQVANIDTYFQCVVGANLPGFHVQNISTQSHFHYYATEFLGVLCNVSPQDAEQVLYECLMLEAIKMTLCLGMIVDYDTTEKLSALLDRQIYIEHLYYPSHAPIITLNAIDNIKLTPTYQRYQQAVQLKISALKLAQERQKTINGRFLNILLYLLSVLGGFQVLDILEAQFNLPFCWGLVVEILFFGGLGMIWYLKEKKE